MANLSQKLTWNPVADAVTYVAKVLTGGGTPIQETSGITVAEVPLATLCAGLSAGSYQARAVAVNPVGVSPDSAPLAFSLDPPAAPTGLAIV